jgi:(p)ppGpp synthase/HD superfamily hydrolase
VERLFGPTVRKIVEGETKVSKLPKMVRSQIERQDLSTLGGDSESKLEEQVENLRSMFIAMADDWYRRARVVCQGVKCQGWLSGCEVSAWSVRVECQGDVAL